MINTLSVVFVILPFANVFVPCPFTFGTIGIGAVSVAFIVLEFTNVFVPTGIGIGAVSVLFAVLPFTNVFVPFGMGIGAVTVPSAVWLLQGCTRQRTPARYRRPMPPHILHKMQEGTTQERSF